MKRAFKTILTLTLALAFLIGVFPFASHTDADNGAKVSGNTGATKTFTVKTGKTKATIEITPYKGVAVCENKFTGRQSTAKVYGDYKITITDQKTGKSSWTTMYSKKAKLKLQADTTYTITVRPLNSSLFEMLGTWSFWYYTGWKKNATWTVTSTRNVTYCG